MLEDFLEEFLWKIVLEDFETISEGFLGEFVWETVIEHFWRDFLRRLFSKTFDKNFFVYTLILKLVYENFLKRCFWKHC